MHSTKDFMLSRAMTMASTPILMVGRNSKTVWVNNSYGKLLGKTSEELVGKMPDILLNLGQHKVTQKKMWDTLLSGNTWSGELQEKIESEMVFWSAIITPLPDAKGNPAFFLLLLHDVTKSKNDLHKMWHVAHHDNLTGLANRSLFMNMVEHTLTQRKRSGGLSAILFIDLDKFKPVNDTYGHAVGDELLRHAAEVLLNNTREEDVVARFGGDEFGVLLTQVQTVENAENIAKKIVSMLCAPVTLSGHEILFGASVGVSIFPNHAESVENMIKAADEAMYVAKAEGRNCFRVYSGNKKD